MAHHSWVGQILGDRYEIQDILGRGGMSSVYKATDPNLRRVVAIKMIHPHLSDNPEFVVRFQEEAAAVAQLRHPNIVQVFDFNNDGETYYMVLEFVVGETLQARLKRLSDVNQLLAMAEAGQFAVQICDAAEYAHQRGMIHRDIKPANIMVDVHEQAILMDFGIAKIIGGQHHTASGATVGTALYMSPEQIRGVQVDGRSDIYSIGVTLFEMLHGRPPFEADSAMTVMMMHLHDPVPDLRQLQPHTPDDLVAVIEKALAKDRKERFRSAAEMAMALREVLEHQQRPQPEREPLAATLAETPAPGAMALGATDLEEAAAPGVEALHGRSGDAGSLVSTLPPWRRLSPALLAGGAAGLILLFIAISVIGSTALGGDDGSGDRVRQTVVGSAAQADDPTSTAIAVTQSAIETAETGAPTPRLTDSPLPGPYVQITDITTQGNEYVVDYETNGFIEGQEGLYIHFFFNTVPPEHAGVTGAYYDGPSPFKRLAVNDRPDGATQMCARVANRNHELLLSSSGTTDTGNCVDLPLETIAPTPRLTDSPLPGPYVQITDITIQGNLPARTEYVVKYETIGFVDSEGIPIHFWFTTVPPIDAGLPDYSYAGLSPFTVKLYQLPPGATQLCARYAPADLPLYSLDTLDTGNCVDLPLETIAPTPAVAVTQPSDPFVRIKKITVTQGRLWLGAPLSNFYEVDYETIGFSESELGFRIHFFFNTVPPEHAGVPGAGPWAEYDGPSPFKRLAVNDRPDGATQMCARVANRNHELLLSSSGTLDTGNCVDLPLETGTPTSVPASADVRITDINVAMGDVYVVEYETIDFTESYDGLHIHFFFNTVPPERAGIPGARFGDYLEHFGPSPFTWFTLDDRPAAATKMCALVAKADETLLRIPSGTEESDYCVDLP